MNDVVVYCSEKSARLSYVLDWLIKERLQLSYSLSTDEPKHQTGRIIIIYGKNIANCFSIPANRLLFKIGTEPEAPLTGNWNRLPTIYAVAEPGFMLPFDLFSAIFFLLSRHEEYYKYSPDRHGRYQAIESILFKNDWLKRPIVDEWVAAFRKTLGDYYGITISATTFTYQPTYDIDIAYSHIFKGFKRIAGAYLKAIIKGDLEQINERTQVLKKKKKDPFDSFSWLREKHLQYGFQPIYFILCALKTTAFDKNINPRHPAMIRVIKQLSREGQMGIHPSYYATQYDIVAKERKTLEEIAGKKVSISRQHYIKLNIPNTYRLLIDNNISEDYSMGYGSYLGFRAGTGSSFFWYDLQNEKATDLRIHPFCFMDTTAHYEGQLQPDQAFEELNKMVGLLKATGSTLVTVFHNFSLGTDIEWQGWSEAYEQFLAGQN